MDEFYVRFEDGSELKISPDAVMKMCFDLKSWFRIMRMLAGYCDFTIMTLRTIDGKESRAAIFKDKPPYRWEMPETA
jgi:hypothetical protein